MFIAHIFPPKPAVLAGKIFGRKNEQVAQLSQLERLSCRDGISYGPKWKTGTGRQYLRTI